MTPLLSLGLAAWASPIATSGCANDWKRRRLEMETKETFLPISRKEDVTEIS
jgi:hypothetical protein